MFSTSSWILFALLSPFFWSFVYVLDSFCVGELFDRPWIGTVTSSLMMLVLSPFLFCGLLVSGVSPVSPTTVLLSLTAGVIFVVGQSLYFRALSFSESGIVAAYFNLLPVILLVVGYLFLGERLTSLKYTGSLILVISSVMFGVVDANVSCRWESLALMLLSACSQAVYFLILESLLQTAPAYQTFVLVTVAMIGAGFVPLLNANCRIVMRGNWPRIRGAIKLLVGVEAINLLAVATNQAALERGPPSLVAAVEATAPAYAFALSAFLFYRFQKYGERNAIHKLPIKFFLVTLMTLGVWMLS